MNDRKQPDRKAVLALVLAALQDTLSEQDMPSRTYPATTRLIGREAVLDSLGLVTLIVDIEQSLEEEYDISISLSDERAMSQTNSPFRSVESIVEYICTLISKKDEWE